MSHTVPPGVAALISQHIDDLLADGSLKGITQIQVTPGVYHRLLSDMGVESYNKQDQLTLHGIPVVVLAQQKQEMFQFVRG